MSRESFKYVSRTPIAYTACQDALQGAIATRLVLTLDFAKLPDPIGVTIKTAMERRFVAAERGPCYRLWAAFAQHYNFPFVAIGKMSNVHIEEKYVTDELRGVMAAYNKISKNKRRRGGEYVATDVVGKVRVLLFPKPDKLAGTSIGGLVWSKFDGCESLYNHAMSALKCDMERGSVTIVGV